MYPKTCELYHCNLYIALSLLLVCGFAVGLSIEASSSLLVCTSLSPFLFLFVRLLVFSVLCFGQHNLDFATKSDLSTIRSIHDALRPSDRLLRSSRRHWRRFRRVRCALPEADSHAGEVARLPHCWEIQHSRCNRHDGTSRLSRDTEELPRAGAPIEHRHPPAQSGVVHLLVEHLLALPRWPVVPWTPHALLDAARWLADGFRLDQCGSGCGAVRGRWGGKASRRQERVHVGRSPGRMRCSPPLQLQDHALSPSVAAFDTLMQWAAQNLLGSENLA